MMSERARGSRSLWTALEWVVRLALAGLYLFAAWGKITDPLSFARALHNYRILPEVGIVPAALALPLWEALAAAAILLGILYRGAVLSLLAMSLVFAAAVSSAVIRGIDLDCGCFGSGVESKADLGHILLNLLTAGAASWLLWRARRTAPQPVWRRGTSSEATSAKTFRA